MLHYSFGSRLLDATSILVVVALLGREKLDTRANCTQPSERDLAWAVATLDR